MNLYIWRHNKTYHSHSMINEPCVVNEFYLDALAIVEAETLDDALKLLEERNEGWRRWRGLKWCTPTSGDR